MLGMLCYYLSYGSFLNSYSKNLGQPRLTDRGAAGFKQASPIFKIKSLANHEV